MVGGSGKSRLRSVPGVNVTRTGPRACRALVIGSPLRASWSATAAGVARAVHLNREDRFSFQERHVRFSRVCRAAAVAATIACVAAGAARADDDEDCNNIMDELKKLSERLMNTTDPKGIGPVCAATGQLLGIIKASREVAAECYDEGRKRDQILLTFDKA